MIVLDTNVISEAIKPLPSDEVRLWMESQPVSTLYITAITEAELLYGIELMPRGKRRSELNAIVEAILEQAFRGRILPFGTDAAHAYAAIMSGRRALGRPIKDMDAQIAAIVLSHRASLATRDFKHFEQCGVVLINPWKPNLIH